MRRHTGDRMGAAISAAVAVAITLCVIELFGGCAWRSGGPVPCQPRNGSTGDGDSGSRGSAPCEIRR